VLLVIVGMVVFVISKAWPSFAHNGLAWFGSGGNVDDQLTAIFNSPANPDYYVYTMHAWPLLYGTALVTVGAVVVGLGFALFAAIFIVEFAPERIRKILEPVVRLLAAVPSVIYGLIGILVLVPFVGNHVISQDRKESVAYVVQLSGNSLIVAVVVLTVMITPIMIALIVDALRTVPRSWTEGAHALGANRWRVVWTIAVRAARPAIVGACVLATARALVRRSCSRWSRARSDSRRTRSTARPSSSSRCGRSRRRSSTTPRACPSSRSGRRCTRSPPSCSSRACSCRSGPGSSASP
jgi:phosphate transport system permease protein